MLVTGSSNDGLKIQVIHYTESPNPEGSSHSLASSGSGAKGKIIEEELEIDPEKDRVELLTYDEGTAVNSPEEAIKQARSREGEKEYSLTSNNCECFVNLALINESISYQAAEAGDNAVVGGIAAGYASWNRGDSWYKVLGHIALGAADQVHQGREKRS